MLNRTDQGQIFNTTGNYFGTNKTFNLEIESNGLLGLLSNHGTALSNSAVISIALFTN